MPKDNQDGQASVSTIMKQNIQILKIKKNGAHCI